MPKTFYIIDGHYQIYRAFYGMAPGGAALTSPRGEPTNATHLFCMMLFNLIRQRHPDHLAMVMDVSDETVFRRELADTYKAQRDPAPDGLHLQADRIVSIVSALGVPIYRVPGFEADDLMATLAEQLRDEDVRVYLVSRDKDLDQLVNDRVWLFDPMKQLELNAEAVLAAKGYTPAQAVEVQTLAGDSTDNIPGVVGVGVKTAIKLVNQYGSAAAVIEHAAELTPKLAERVKAFAPQMPLTRQLVTLRRDVSFEWKLADCELCRLNIAAVRPIFDELGFTTARQALESLSMVLPASHDRSPAPELIPPIAPPVTVGPKVEARYELVNTQEALDRLALDLAAKPAFAFDTETTGLSAVQSQLVGISLAYHSGEAFYIPVRGSMGPVLPVDQVVAALKPAFENPAITKVGHNLKFDMLALRQAGLVPIGLQFDTMIASFLLDPTRRSHSLDSLAKGILDHDMIPITDLIGRGKDQISMDQVDIRRVCEYAAEDADFTWRLYEYFAPQIRGSHVERLFSDVEMPLVAVLVEMENNGVAIDPVFLKSLGKGFEDRLVELTREIHRLAGHAFNLDSPKQLATVLFEEQGFSSVRQTKTGRSTDAETLAALAGQGENPLPRLVLEYRELAKLKGTYVDTLPTMINPRTGRVHASFNQIGAITGRLSSSDPNLQNIPIRTETGRRIREAFIAGQPDHVLLTADYSQIELRLLAHFSLDETLLGAFRAGQDIHRAVAAQVQGIPLDQVTPSQRSAAKAVNFGIIYGQTPFGLSRTIGIPVGEARTFIEKYFQRYPGIRRFITQCIDNARSTGSAETILGRRRPIPELRSQNRGQVALGERLAINSVVQGSAADLIKKAMIDIHQELSQNRHPGRMVLQVHDELVFEANRSAVQAFADMVREKMENCMPLSVPIVADVAWGRSWADMK